MLFWKEMARNIENGIKNIFQIIFTYTIAFWGKFMNKSKTYFNVFYSK